MRPAALRAPALALLLLSGCFKLDPFLYTPQRTDRYVFNPVGKDAESTVAAEQIGEPFFIPVTDQVQIAAVYVRATVQPPRAFALLFHGKGPHMAADGQFERAKRLANLGYDTLAIDYRGFGMSTDVTPTEAGIEEDTRAALAWLTAAAGGADRVFLYGHSLGAAIAIQRASIDPPPALIVESAFASLEELKVDASLMDFPDDYLAKDSWDSSGRIKSIGRALIIHGLQDDFVRPEFSELLYAQAKEPKQLVLVEGADHGTCAPMLGPRFAELVHGWVDQFIAAR
ncbi:MAG TPA: alpha/beta fold hydrolase [Myxococcales bacterium]|nr:alpha/beta fold hydrolase [Myxococcales bacterium]